MRLFRAIVDWVAYSLSMLPDFSGMTSFLSVSLVDERVASAGLSLFLGGMKTVATLLM
jgi:hypothetical protein